MRTRFALGWMLWATTACSPLRLAGYCGDGVVDPDNLEQCEPAGDVAPYRCGSDCRLEAELSVRLLGPARAGGVVSAEPGALSCTTDKIVNECRGWVPAAQQIHLKASVVDDGGVLAANTSFTRWAGCDANDAGVCEWHADGGQANLGAVFHHIYDISGSVASFCMLSRGEVRCWGRNDFCESGGCPDGNLNEAYNPASRLPMADYVDLDNVQSRNCGVHRDGRFGCWGQQNRFRGGFKLNSPVGVLPVGTDGSVCEESSDGPCVARELSPLGVVQVGLTQGGTCLLDELGRVYCFGVYSSPNELPGEIEPANLESFRVALDGSVAQLSSSEEGSCALVETGAIYCWGQGQAPEMIADSGYRYVALGRGLNDSGMVDLRLCAIAADAGVVDCWDPRGDAGFSPSDATPAPIFAEAVQVGYDVVYALDRGGVLRAWGSSPANGSGIGRTDPSHFYDGGIVQTGLTFGGRVLAVAGGHQATCVVLQGGDGGVEGRCWGSDNYCQTGLCEGGFSNPPGFRLDIP